MARVTVEDCLENVANRFELVMISSKRARQLAIEGKEAKVPWENDKPTVVALREIAEGLVTADILNPAEPDEAEAFLLGDEMGFGSVVSDREELGGAADEPVSENPD